MDRLRRYLLVAAGWAGIRGTVTLAAALSIPLVLQNGAPVRLARAVVERRDADRAGQLGADQLRMSLWSAVDPMPDGAALVQIGERDWELAKNYPVELAVRADVKETLRALLPVYAFLRGRPGRFSALAGGIALACILAPIVARTAAASPSGSRCTSSPATSPR